MRADVTLTGEAQAWAMTADSGHAKTRAFCPTCGAPVYMTFSAMPDLLTIRAASLDDPSRYTPQAVTYSSRAPARDPTNPALPKFATMPPR